MAQNLQVKQNSLSGAGESSYTGGTANRLGQQVVMDFYTFMALSGAAYQVRAGTLSVPLVGDVLITDTAAEMAVDAATGLTILPVFVNISFNLAAATLFETAGKSVATVSSAGTAFVPLPLRSNGAAATSTARVAAAGGVTVTAELATTTLRHFSWGHPIAAGAWPTIYEWTPRTPPVLVGPRSFYVQIAADTTGPSYFSNVDYIECPTATLL
jgi:hypothetical protein